MADSMSTPRISAMHLEAFKAKTVRILGKVTQIRGDNATVDAGGQINIILNRDAHLQVGHAFEIVGKVTSDLSVRALATTDFGTDIDMKAADAVVAATHNYNSIFYDREQ